MDYLTYLFVWTGFLVGAIIILLLGITGKYFWANKKNLANILLSIGLAALVLDFIASYLMWSNAPAAIEDQWSIFHTLRFVVLDIGLFGGFSLFFLGIIFAIIARLKKEVKLAVKLLVAGIIALLVALISLFITVTSI